ncbi:major facilitator superfamily domain-containing protein [Mycotypha africana]|uniref:major facilitator superfamily domain-containing protein n=1 Tax=Mycotypha africana TaxID=64632 RepID=UPI002301CBCD|nr:major facilitator superfamily domain-containing protein [Mycotypha africana]KAI8992056.1 major facilitator superfamily domain-containing protein [Mycotypha africana]
MTSWAIVTWAHCLVHNFAGFLTVRILIAATEGGFIPTCLTYMTRWYKTTEMATRLACFWAAQNLASASSGLIAFGVFRLEGTLGLEGWKWLFIVDGIITHVVGFMAFFYVPSSPMRTAGKLRGKKGWLTERQSRIATLRIFRDDETKRSGDKHVSLKDILQAATDTNLWVHLIITFLGQMHETPIYSYLPSIIKDSGFATTTANLLAAPAYIINLIFSVIIAHNSDKRGNVALHAIIGSAWALLGVCLLEFLPDTADRWSLYGAALFAASAPSWHGMQIAWMSANLAPNGKRSIALAAVIAFANINGVPGSQLYRKLDRFMVKILLYEQKVLLFSWTCRGG